MTTWRKHTPLLFLSVLIVLLAGCSTPSTTNEGASEPLVEASTPNMDAPSNAALPADTAVPSNTDAPAVSTDSDELPTDGELQVHFIDVGQGASQLIIGPTGKTILIDAGDNHMEETVVGYLNQLAITNVDILIGTHPDADHIGGLDKVIDHFEIGAIYMPKVQANTKTFESVLRSIQKKNLKVTTAKAGLQLPWEPGVDVKMIAPIQTYNDANEMSAVVHLTYGERAFLFTGDAEQKSEQDMLDSGVGLKADVLLVGHHGSASSTSEAFLKEVAPTYAVIQVGKENRYGHPAEEVLARLQAQGAMIYRNDEEGTILFRTDGKEISVEQNPWHATEPSAPLPTATPGQEAGMTTSTSTEPEPNHEHPAPLTVTTSIDEPTPKQNSEVTVRVQVQNGEPVPDATVVLTLHYKSKETIYEGKTDADGVSTLSFKIGRAAKGYTVDGDIAVTKGQQHGKSQISFTPQ